MWDAPRCSRIRHTGWYRGAGQRAEGLHAEPDLPRDRPNPGPLHDDQATLAALGGPAGAHVGTRAGKADLAKATQNPVAAIISLAGNLNMQVVAEGVETAQQLAFLRDQGCNEAQGFGLSRPLPADQMTELLSQSPRWTFGHPGDRRRRRA